MKTRSGYVSNSSSSSFIIYGVPTESVNDIEEWLDEGKKVTCIAEAGGTSGDVGDFVFTMTKERFNLMKRKLAKIMSISDFYIIQEQFASVNEDVADMKFPELKGGNLFMFNKDYNSPKDDSVDDSYFLKWLGSYR